MEIWLLLSTWSDWMLSLNMHKNLSMGKVRDVQLKGRKGPQFFVDTRGPHSAAHLPKSIHVYYTNIHTYEKTEQNKTSLLFMYL